MKTLIAAMMSVPLLLAAVSPASADVDYVWHDDCRESPGNNLKCVRIKTMVKYQDGSGKLDVHVDRVKFILEDWCGAGRVSGGTGWGVNPFTLTGSNGDTTFNRYYVVPASCQYHLHGRRVTGTDHTGAADTEISWSNSHNCIEFNIQDSHVNTYSCTEFDNGWPKDKATGRVPLD